MELLFDHERLEVYQLARQFNREVCAIILGVRRGHAESIDNLVRAAKSITRNLAEGGGRWGIADKIRFYHIARASATECAAGLDELVDYGALAEGAVSRPKQTLSRVVAMLIAMIHSLEARGTTNMTRTRAP